MKCHVVNSFSGFHKIISQYNPREYMFRGVANSTYKLRPKIGRKDDHLYGDLYTYETTIMNQFKKLSVPFLTNNPENEWEWLAIAQHHGLPTRLLDWTMNPMVAAYFAVNQDYDVDGVIYSMDNSQLDSNIDFDYEPYVYDETDEVRIFEPKHITSRIIAQNGIFTIHNDPTKPLEETPDIIIEKIIIKKKFKKELRHILNVYGINKATLFPGLDGITEYLDWYTTK